MPVALSQRERQLLDAYSELWSYPKVAARLGLTVGYCRQLGSGIIAALDARSIGHAIQIYRTEHLS